MSCGDAMKCPSRQLETVSLVVSNQKTAGHGFQIWHRVKISNETEE